MLIVISPAKTLDYDSPSPTKRFTQPQFLDHSEVLIDVLADYSPEKFQN